MVKVHVESVREIVLMFEGLVSVDTYGALMLMRVVVEWTSIFSGGLANFQEFHRGLYACRGLELPRELDGWRGDIEAIA